MQLTPLTAMEVLNLAVIFQGQKKCCCQIYFYLCVRHVYVHMRVCCGGGGGTDTTCVQVPAKTTKQHEIP